MSSGCHQAAACSAAKPAKERGGRPVTCRTWLVTGARLLLAITLWSSRNAVTIGCGMPELDSASRTVASGVST